MIVSKRSIRVLSLSNRKRNANVFFSKQQSYERVVLFTMYCTSSITCAISFDRRSKWKRNVLVLFLSTWNRYSGTRKLDIEGGKQTGSCDVWKVRRSERAFHVRISALLIPNLHGTSSRQADFATLLAVASVFLACKETNDATDHNEETKSLVYFAFEKRLAFRFSKAARCASNDAFLTISWIATKSLHEDGKQADARPWTFFAGLEQGKRHRNFVCICFEENKDRADALATSNPRRKKHRWYRFQVLLLVDRSLFA